MSSRDQHVDEDEAKFVFTPINLALIIAGASQAHFATLKKYLDNVKNVYWFDVRPDLGVDPSNGGVGHYENGTYPVTINQVFRQGGFAVRRGSPRGNRLPRLSFCAAHTCADSRLHHALQAAEH